MCLKIRTRAFYRVVQKTDIKFYFCDNFGNSAPILTILSLLQAEIRNSSRVNLKFFHPKHLYCVSVFGPICIF